MSREAKLVGHGQVETEGAERNGFGLVENPELYTEEGQKIIQRYSVMPLHDGSVTLDCKFGPWQSAADNPSNEDVQKATLGLVYSFMNREGNPPSLGQLIKAKKAIRQEINAIEGKWADKSGSTQDYIGALFGVRQKLGLAIFMKYLSDRHQAARVMPVVAGNGVPVEAGVGYSEGANAEPRNEKRKRKNDDGEGASWRPSDRVASYVTIGALLLGLGGGEADAQEVDTAHRGEGETNVTEEYNSQALNLDAIIEESEPVFGTNPLKSTINIRSGTSTDTEEVGALAPGAQLKVLEKLPADETGDGMVWYKVELEQDGEIVEAFVRNDVFRVDEEVKIYEHFETLGISSIVFQNDEAGNYADKVHGGLHYLVEGMGKDLSKMEIMSQNSNGMVLRDEDGNFYYIGDAGASGEDFEFVLRVFDQEGLNAFLELEEGKTVEMVFPENEQTALANMVVHGEDGKILRVVVLNGNPVLPLDEYLNQYSIDVSEMNLPDDARAIIDTGNENALVINGVIVGYVQQGGELELIDGLETSEVRDFVEENAQTQALYEEYMVEDPAQFMRIVSIGNGTTVVEYNDGGEWIRVEHKHERYFNDHHLSSMIENISHGDNELLSLGANFIGIHSFSEVSEASKKTTKQILGLPDSLEIGKIDVVNIAFLHKNNNGGEVILIVPYMVEHIDFTDVLDSMERKVDLKGVIDKIITGGHNSITFAVYGSSSSMSEDQSGDGLTLIMEEMKDQMITWAEEDPDYLKILAFHREYGIISPEEYSDLVSGIQGNDSEQIQVIQLPAGTDIVKIPGQVRRNGKLVRQIEPDRQSD